MSNALPAAARLRSVVCLLAALCLLCAPPALAAAGGSVDRPLPAAGALLRLPATSPFEEPFVSTGATAPGEDEALLRAVRAYRAQPAADDFRAFDVFLSDYPRSGWRMALLTNLGLAYYRGGYFSKAIDVWEQAWEAGRAVSGPPPAKALADRAAGELARMHARLGHADRLEGLLEEIGDRPVTGPATEAITGAREGLWMMRNEPGTAFLCGPMALKNLLLSQDGRRERVTFIDAYRSGPKGVTLAQVAGLAEEAGLAHRLVFRRPGQSIPVPSIVHWKVSHFAAIVGEAGGRFHIQDPTFGQDLWITRAALDAESSGYFLVPREQASAWREVETAEAGRVRGMGFTTQQQTGANTPDEPQTGCSGGGSPANPMMCGYSIMLLTVGLNLSDTPVGYAPPKGPPAYVTLTYNQREDSQPAIFGWFNVSPKWTLNWLSYIEDDPNNANANVMRFVAGGGSVTYLGFNSGTGAFAPETRDASVLVRTAASPIRYERRLPDGSLEIYGQSNGAATSPRRVFLTQRVDRHGNAVTLEYDGQLRLTTLTDATGRQTSFSYGLTASPLLITKITDPFGRSATLAYDASGRLSRITDVLGIASQFTYDASGLITALTTPYGTTTFAFGQNGTTRWLNATDPLGQTERVEFQHTAPGMPYSDPPSTVPQGMGLSNDWLYYRNTFHWDKHAYQIAAGDYNRARITHWHHWLFNSSQTARSIESIKNPLENRVWFTYPGQTSGSFYSGTFDKPNAIGRVLDDGTSQVTRIAYNAAGNVSSAIDPVGRETLFDYDANQIDLLRVRQKISASGYATIAEFTYNAQHLPLTYKDAAGRTTSYAYNAAGQPLQVTDALGRVTRFEYDGLGYLTRIVNPNGQTAARFTYDGFGRVATRTDSEGHAVSFAYDAFDRVTRETYPDGTTRDYGYDKLDLVTVKDRQGRVTRYAYDAVRQLAEVTDPLNRKTRFGRYANGVLKSLTDAKGNVTSWDIDLQSRVTAKRYADGRQYANAYEATTSRLKTLTDALGQKKNYSYTPDDQLAGIAYTDSVNPTPNVTFAYDAFFRRVTSMTDGTGTTQYAYHAAGGLGALQLAQENGPFGNDTIGYQYDALGRLTTRTADTSAESFAYDALGRTMGHSSPLGSFTLSYLGQTGQLSSRKLQGSTLGTDWAYDGNGNDRRLKAIVNSGASRGYQYTTTPENIIAKIVETATPAGTAWGAQSWDYGYDDADRLSSGQSSAGTRYAYAYDAADNITSMQGPDGTKTGGYNALNQVTSFGGKAFAYDANGNVTDDGERSYQWDAEDRLIRVTSKAQPSRVTSFRYDGLHRRIAIVTNGAETRYLWCGAAICQARSAADTVTRRYYAEGELIPAGGTMLYYAQDHLGSVRDVLAVQNGARVASFDYDPYGNPSRSAGRVSPDFRYAGMFYHQETGLYLTQYRVYDPRSARWLSRDPIGEPGGTNLYTYAGTSPVNAVDPNGLIPLDTLADLGFIAYDIIQLIVDPCNREENLRALGLDVAGLFIPYATGFGAASRLVAHADDIADATKLGQQTTILGENVLERVIPYAERTDARWIPFGATADEWAALTPRERWKLNDGALRARINEGDIFKYIGRDPFRDPALRTRFDLTGSELLRLNDRGIPYETIPSGAVRTVIGRP